MYRLGTTFVLAAICALGALPGCGLVQKHEAEHVTGSVVLGSAVAVMRSTEGNTARGTVSFVQAADGLEVTADIEGLSPNAKHAIHVHQYGDVTGKDGKKTGGHYNPAGHDHSLPGNEKRHAGDLGNLQADADGKAHYEVKVTNASLTGMHPVLGRGVIIHAKEDDGGQPTGNAGARIAQGVIGIGNPGK